MHITLESTGGFTGPAGTDRWSKDLSALPAAAQARLAAAVAAAHIAEQPPDQRKRAPTPGDFLNVLTVTTDGGESHTIKFHQDAASPALRKLAETIQDIRDDGE